MGALIERLLFIHETARSNRTSLSAMTTRIRTSQHFRATSPLFRPIVDATYSIESIAFIVTRLEVSSRVIGESNLLAFEYLRTRSPMHSATSLHSPWSVTCGRRDCSRRRRSQRRSTLEIKNLIDGPSAPSTSPCGTPGVRRWNSLTGRSSAAIAKRYRFMAAGAGKATRPPNWSQKFPSTLGEASAPSR